MSVLVIRAELGRVVLSQRLDEDLYETVRRYVAMVINEWDPARSDLLVMRDVVEMKAEGSEPRGASHVEVVASQDGSVLRFPVYLISFDSEEKSEDVYEERKIYLIAPYVNEEIKEMLESYAEELTSSPGELGVKET